MALTDGLRRKKTGRQAEQGTDNSGTEIHFRFPAGPRPAGAVSGEGPGGKRICLDAKYLRGKSSPTYIDKGRFVRENDSISFLIHLSQMYQKQYLRKQDTDLSPVPSSGSRQYADDL